MSEDQAQDVVSYRVEDRIAWVYFARPEKRNCMNPA
ncbi:MAG: p-hydroxycinnamoyl CoA hydratase/lyase, partial [Sphingomonadales bacterium]|nr:p-hydroxycinnamoyl CoA hydratase/lyase [Sphingomonadales bacterium]